jgi:polyisoprenoid-binding protein YceI
MRLPLFLSTLLLAGLALPAMAAPTTYTVDPGHTQAVVQWSHFGFSHPYAAFGSITGTLVYDPVKPQDSHVDITIPMDKLNSLVPKLDEHLKGADFFDTPQYPTARFTSTAVHVIGKQMHIQGNLTLRGKTHPVTLMASLNGSGKHPMSGNPAVGFSATTTIKRSDFGIDKMVPAISDEISIQITLEASAPSAN